jgi:hypothetical protein
MLNVCAIKLQRMWELSDFMQIFHISVSDVTAAENIFLFFLQISPSTVLQIKQISYLCYQFALDYKYKNVLKLEVIIIWPNKQN